MSLFESRDDITHVDLEAQEPLPPRLDPPPPFLLDVIARHFGFPLLLAVVFLVARGCR